MVRSLVIRQVFRFLDIFLVAATLGAVGFVVKQFTTPIPGVEVDESQLSGSTVEAASLIRNVSDRASYDRLVKSGLFGASGRWDPDAAPLKPEPEPTVEAAADIAESALNLSLKGTIALGPGDPFSVAFIENTEKREPAKSFLLKQEVIDKVELEQVYPREVILLNKRNNPPQRERLRMDEASLEGGKGQDAAQLASASASAPQRPTPAPSSDSPVERITISRDELMQDVLENYSALAELQPQLKRDESGNVLGLTAANISEFPLASKLGFADDDVLQTVNNERIDSEEKIMEILGKYQNASSFRIGILRNGKPQVITYRLE